MSALEENKKLTSIILRVPNEHAQTIHTVRQLAKGGDLPIEPTLKELRQAMFDYFRAKESTGRSDKNYHKMNQRSREDSNTEIEG